jgi:mRNA interferase MazF
MDYRRGDIFFAELEEGTGSEQQGTRPVVIIQNNIGNKFSPTLIVACITSQIKTKLPTHVSWDTSTILCEQIKTIDKSRLGRFLGSLTTMQMEKVNYALRVSLGIV